MALRRKQQLFLASEAQEATPTAIGSLVVAANGEFLAIDPTLEFDVQRIERSISRGTLTPSQGITGLRTATLRFGLEITGSVSPDKPQISLPLQACGFREELVAKCYIGAITPSGGNNYFKHGEVVDIGADTDQGIVVMDTYVGSPYILIARQNGLRTSATNHVPIATDVITGQTTGCTATITDAGAGSDPVNASSGYAYWPVTTALTKLTVGASLDVALAVGDVVRGFTSGALGVVEVAAPDTNTVIFIRHVSGVWQAEVLERVSPGTPDANIATITAISQFAVPTLSGALTKDGVWEAANGLRGNVTLTFPVGEIPTAQFEFKGSYTTHQDSSNVSGISFPQYVPAPVLAAEFKMAAVNEASLSLFAEPCVASLEIATNNELSQRQCVNADSGVLAYEITARAPSASVDPELQPEAFFAVMDKFLNNENVTLEIYVHPVAIADRDGRKFRFQIPNASVSAAVTGDRNGILTRSLTLTPNTGTNTGEAPAHDNDVIIFIDYFVDSILGY